RNLSQRLDEVGTRIQALADQLAAQDQASHVLLTGLGQELAALDTSFEQLGRTRGEEGQRLSESIAEMRGAARDLLAELGSGDETAAALGGRTRQIADALAALAEQMKEELPKGLARVEDQAG